ncbi:unnamed protein product [Lactuca virosa]|uniref:RRM domain-containing protein n=1 Tax=Lactuca virosa TaxID=75947 RepID=A0AAU9MFM8_9ASTR|nr:unnamed protein product [Lactuca virosa]
MSVKTVKVGNLSLKASTRDVREFFSFSGDIVYVEVQSDDDFSQKAFVTFTDSQGADTAVLLSGATIVDMTVTVTLAPDYHLSPDATSAARGITESEESVMSKAEDVISSMLSKGFILGKDAVSKAKSFDEKIGFSEKVTTGTSMVNEKVKEVDQKLQVSEKAKSAYAAAASWVTDAFSKVAKSASEVGQQTKEKDDVAPTQQPPSPPKTSQVQGLIL